MKTKLLGDLFKDNSAQYLQLHFEDKKALKIHISSDVHNGHA